MESFDREVALQAQLAKLGFSVPVEDYWVCPKVGVIVMKSLDITVKDFLVHATPQDADTIVEACKKLINSLHHQGYYHGDNHFANIMMERIQPSFFSWGEVPNSIRTSLGLYRLYLIDLGKAGKLSEPGVVRGKETTKEKRLLDDDIILEEEARQVRARFHPSSLESLII